MAARQATLEHLRDVVLHVGAARAGRGGRAGRRPRLARDAVERLAETTQPCGTDWALGIEARCRALLSDGAAADDLYREAIDRLSRTRLRPELARAHLLYGEWLRREGRRVDAARAVARGVRHARGDWHGGVRRARPPGADRDGREGAQAQRRDARPAHAAGGADCPAGPRRPHQSRRSAPGCSCPRARSNGTCARYSPSSASAPAASCTPRWRSLGKTASRPSARARSHVNVPGSTPCARLRPGGRAGFWRSVRWT